MQVKAVIPMLQSAGGVRAWRPTVDTFHTSGSILLIVIKRDKICTSVSTRQSAQCFLIHTFKGRLRHDKKNRFLFVRSVS